MTLAAVYRVVVVVESVDAYEVLPAPLLNRFEKQVRPDAVNLLHGHHTCEALLPKIM